MRFVIFLLLFPLFLVAQVNTESMRGDDEEGFHLRGNFSYLYKDGNSEQIQTKNSLRVDYIAMPYYAFAVGSVDYGETASLMDTKKGFAHVRGGYEIIKHLLSLELFGQEEYNEFILIKRRDLAGFSPRFELYGFSGVKSRAKIYLGAGAMAERENLIEDQLTPDEVDENNEFHLRSTNYLSLNLAFDKRVVFSLVGYYQPLFSSFDDFKVLVESTLEVKITDLFALSSSLNYRYDSEPPSILKKYDVEILNGVSISF